MSELLPAKRYSDEWRRHISEGRTGIKVSGEHLYRDNPKLGRIYDGMKQRCYNPKRDNYERYGGRGIRVCDEWLESSTPFIKWALENGYEDGLQLDRIDNSGNYEPSNCRWVTPKNNSRNTRRSKHLTLNGETKTVAEWCETLPISEFTIYWWLKEYGQEECEQRVYKRLENAS